LVCFGWLAAIRAIKVVLIMQSNKRLSRAARRSCELPFKGLPVPFNSLS
jgi:hypothetical protein